MTRVEEALIETVSILDSEAIPYMLIGGLAVAQWGEPRATFDVDVTLWVEGPAFHAALERLAKRFTPRMREPLAFAAKSRVLPVLTSQGVPVDLIFAAWPFEKDAIDGAVEMHAGGIPIRVAPIAHLLFTKLVSDRKKDVEDAANLMRRHGASIDHEWLHRQLADTAEGLSQPEILTRYLALRPPQA